MDGLRQRPHEGLSLLAHLGADFDQNCEINYDNQSYKCDVRLHGTDTDNFYGKKKSYAIKLKKDSLIINYKLEEIRLLNEQILLYNVRIMDLNVWYRRPWVGYIAGTVSTILTVHLINYTLP